MHFATFPSGFSFLRFLLCRISCFTCPFLTFHNLENSFLRCSVSMLNATEDQKGIASSHTQRLEENSRFRDHVRRLKCHSWRHCDGIQNAPICVIWCFMCFPASPAQIISRDLFLQRGWCVGARLPAPSYVRFRCQSDGLISHKLFTASLHIYVTLRNAKRRRILCQLTMMQIPLLTLRRCGALPFVRVCDKRK